MQNASPMITAAIGGVITVIVALVVYPIMQSAADTLYLDFVEHCEIGSESFLRVYKAGEQSGDILAPPLGTVGDSSGACSVTVSPGASNATTEVRSEHGVKVSGAVTASTSGIANLASGETIAWAGTSKWVDVKEVLAQYSGISTLVLSILPILAVTGFLGVSANNIYQYTQGGSMGIQRVVVESIVGLIVAIVGIFLAPTIFDFLNDVFLVSTDGRYGIMSQFSTIIKLVISFVPVIYISGLLAVYAWQGTKAIQGLRAPRG